MRAIKFILLFLLIFSCESVNNSKDNSNYDNLPRYGKVKDFNIENFNYSNVENQTWLFNLFFTSCRGPCPVTMSNIKKIKDKNPNLTVVSLSVDPKRDTPEAIKAYIEKLDLNTDKWFLISTSKENRKKIIEDNFEIEDMEDSRSHSNRVFLIDQNNEIRGAYVGTLGFDIEKLEEDLAKLL